MSLYSYSRIATYKACPLRYKYAYIDEVKTEAEETLPAYMDARVHEALERLYRNLQVQQQQSLEEILAFYHQQWKLLAKDTRIFRSTPKKMKSYHDLGARYIRDYYLSYQPFDEGKILDLEVTDFMPLDDTGKHDYYIRIERLMGLGKGVYAIHDYKTDKTLPDQARLDEDSQLGMYALWVSQEYDDLKYIRLVWHFLALNQEMVSHRKRSQLEMLKQNILEKACEIETTHDFPPSVSKLCEWCLFHPMCPMWQSHSGSIS